jgi:limonene-1,2-epoxide hydrolase
MDGADGGSGEENHAAMKTNEQIIRDFIAAWSRLDVGELVQYFTPDGVYHNMPTQPVAGHDALRGFISGFTNDWASTQWDVLNLVSQGEVVIAERLDRTMVGDKPVNLPCCGVFEMQAGKIKVWRDYFDMGTYVSALRG